jgi:hypothetical protein
MLLVRILSSSDWTATSIETATLKITCTANLFIVLHIIIQVYMLKIVNIFLK